jgi:hypothetical protein
VNRRLLTCATIAVVSALAVAPSYAAKKKPKTIHGSYHVTVAPNPTMEGTDELLPGSQGCNQTVPGGRDDHPLVLPAAGKLTVTLDGADPTGGSVPAGPDWDLYLLDTDGSVLDSSTGANAHEQVADTFKKKQKVTISACNLVGTPDGTVTWSFTYR